jgi:hypothetical protein
MANQWVESFDNVSTATLPLKGWVLGSTPTIVAGAARTGAQGLRCVITSQHATKAFAETDVVFVGFSINPAVLPGSSGIIASLKSPVGLAHVSLHLNAAGQIVVTRSTSTSTTLGTTVESIPTGVHSYIEWGVTIHDTTGIAIVRINGNEVLNLTGQDTRNSTSPISVSSLQLLCAVASNYDFDDVYVNDDAGTAHNTFEGDKRVYCLSPSGNGASSDLVGSDSNSTDNYLLVDETTSPSTADYVGSAVDNDHDTYAFTDLAGTLDVSLVQTSVYAFKSDAGVRSFAPVIRSGGTDDVGTDRALSVAALYHQHTYEQNPVTDAPWTQAEVNAAEFGFMVRP